MLKRKKLRKSKNSRVQELSIGFDRTGTRYLDQIADHFKKSPVGVSLLELAWTAGPVTFIALQSGHWLGFGNAAPIKNVIYFVSYTLIAGIIAVSIRFVRRPIHERKVAEVKSTFSTVTNILYDLIMSTKDIELRNCSIHERDVELFRLFLSKPGVSPNELYRTCKLATGSEEFSELLYRIIIYRSNALFTLEQELIHDNGSLFNEILKKLSNENLQVATELKEFIYGNTATFKRGSARPIGFIERVLTAGEADDISLISISDVEAVFILAMELLHGASFQSYQCKAVGLNSGSDVIRKVNKLRAKRRRDLVKFYCLLHSIAYLNKCDSDLTFHRTSIRQEIDSIYQDVIVETDGLVAKIQSMMQEVKQCIIADQKLYSHVKLLKRIIDLHDKMVRLRRSIAIRTNSLAEYSAVLQKYEENKKTKSNIEKINIVSCRLETSDKQRFELAKQLKDSMENVTLIDFSKHKPKFVISHDAVCHIATDICSILDDMFDVSDMQIQKGIEFSNAPTFNAVEYDNSTNYKLGLAKSLVADVNDTRSAAVKTVVHSLRDIYRVNMTAEIKEYLAQELNLPVAVIESELNIADQLSFPSHDQHVSLPEMRSTPVHWRECYIQALNFLKQRGT